MRDNLALLGLGLWVARFDHADIHIVAFDARGRRMGAAEFFRTWRPTLMARDMGGSPRLAIQHGVGSIRVAVPREEPLSLEILWPVAGFGKVLLRADNRGHGFRISRDATTTIELVPELARSRIEELRSWVAEHNGSRLASDEANRHLGLADLVMRDLARAGDQGRRAALAYDALRAALFASEQEVIAESRDSIERVRRGAMAVTILDRSGRPLGNGRVHVSEERQDFLFGAFAARYDAETVARMRSAGLNYATLYLNWLATEPRDGFLDFPRLDREFVPDNLREDGFTLRGHALVWLANAGMPSWMEPMRGDPDAVRDAVKRHVGAIVGHYAKDVQIWEANNEGHAAWASWGLDHHAMIEVVRAAATEIRRRAPASQIMINLALPLGEDVSLKYYPLIGRLSGGRIDESAIDPYAFAERLIHAGIRYDLLGLQFYNGCFVDVRGGVQVPAIDLFRFASVLERYGRLGKPIHITEIAAPSAARDDPGESYWHARANPRIQADYLAGIFTIAYGSPNVSGINWWDFYDDHPFADSGGLFDRAGGPKPAYFRMRELLASWRFEGEVTTDVRGVASFKGPPGEYRFTAREGGGVVSALAHITPDESRLVALRPSALPAAAQRAARSATAAAPGSPAYGAPSGAY